MAPETCLVQPSPKRNYILKPFQETVLNKQIEWNNEIALKMFMEEYFEQFLLTIDQPEFF